MSQALVPLVPTELSPLLGRLELPGGAWPANHSTGAHLSPTRGQSVEFFEHRDYQFGDDPRRIDWRASAKGDRTMVRFGEREQNNPVYIFLDSHRAMAYGPKDPPERWSWARGIAALLAHSALTRGDPVGLAMNPQSVARASTGRSNLAQIAKQLGQAPNAGCSQLTPCLQAWSQLNAAPARLFFISDWLDLSTHDQDHDQSAQSFFGLLGDLRQQGHRFWGLELLHHDELELRFSSSAKALNFTDPTQRRPSQIGDPEELREQYTQALGAHRRALANLANHASMHWCPMRSDHPWANALHEHLHPARRGR